MPPPLGTVCIIKTPIRSPSLPHTDTDTDTHLHTLSPTVTPCCAHAECTPNTAATKWESGRVVRDDPRQRRPMGHPTDTQTPPPSTITPPSHLTQLRPRDRHLSRMPRCRVLQSTAGWCWWGHLYIISSLHLGKEGGREWKDATVSLASALQSS